MSYQVVFSKQATKQIRKLDNTTKKLLENWLRKHLVNCDNPRAFGKGLSWDKSGLWRYRIGNYRLICDIKDEELLIIALTFGNRSEVYTTTKK